MTLDDFRANLESGDTARCVRALAQASSMGQSAVPVAQALLADEQRGRRTRNYSLRVLFALVRFDRAAVISAAIYALGISDAGTRAIALHILEDLRPPEAVQPVAALLGDVAADPTDWSDDP